MEPDQPTKKRPRFGEGLDSLPLAESTVASVSYSNPLSISGLRIDDNATAASPSLHVLSASGRVVLQDVAPVASVAPVPASYSRTGMLIEVELTNFMCHDHVKLQFKPETCRMVWIGGENGSNI